MDSAKHGKALREKVSRKSQGDFKLHDKERSVIDLIELSNYDRIQELVPIRHKRMSASPFSFYRATAGIMARDLAHLPRTEINVQAIGDCHLMNFGGFATPERILVFDANDFDETLPASWEWDLKRLATSFVLSARENSMIESDAKDVVSALVQTYRQQVYQYSQMNLLDLWYTKFDFETLRKNASSGEVRRLLEKAIARSGKTNQESIFYKITSNLLGKYEINEQPPLIYHPIDVKKEHEMILTFLDHYAQTLQDDRRWLFEQYEIVDIALKVVGVGSVGTRCYVVLMMNKKKEPLFIQVKEARASVLEPFTAISRYSHNGQRVVEGQRLVQAASDIFLGWSTGPAGRHFYFRQLRDRKVSPAMSDKDKVLLNAYARLCGRVLARAHAKTGDATMIAGYMGKGEVLDNAIVKFAVAYADQTENDYTTFMKGIKSGRLPISEQSVQEGS
ncbi:MAG: DUF2252 domain-containing protein [Chitinophagales bacterium]